MNTKQAAVKFALLFLGFSLSGAAYAGSGHVDKAPRTIVGSGHVGSSQPSK